MEIVWKKSRLSDSSGECVWVADIGALQQQLGENAPIKIYDKEIPLGIDVVVRDEDENVCLYTYDEFGIFALGVKDGDFDELIAKSSVAQKSVDESKESTLPRTHVSIVHVPVDVDGVSRRPAINLGYIEIDAEGKITGKITHSSLREGLKTEDVYFDVLMAELIFKPAFPAMKE